MTRKTPRQKRGESNQIVGTPWEFIHAVQREFGPLWYDLAALETNRKCVHYIGPDHSDVSLRNSLEVNWRERLYETRYPNDLTNWLNPEYANIAPWAKKCAKEAALGVRVLMLVPASIGANWWNDIAVPHADIYSVGRMTFDGSKDGYPKDLALCHFWKLGGHKTKRWHWDETKKRRAA